MTRQNVELMWRVIVASTARPPDFQAVNELYHPEHVLTSDWGVEGRVYHGAQGFAEAIADLDAAWQEWHQEVEQVRDKVSASSCSRTMIGCSRWRRAWALRSRAWRSAGDQRERSWGGHWCC